MWPVCGPTAKAREIPPESASCRTEAYSLHQPSLIYSATCKTMAWHLARDKYARDTATWSCSRNRGWRHDGGKDIGLAPPFWRSAGGRSASLRSKYRHRGPAQARIQNPVLRRALTYLFAHFATHKG